MSGAWWFLVGWLFVSSVSLMYLVAIVLNMARRLLVLEGIVHTQIVRVVQQANDG